MKIILISLISINIFSTMVFAGPRIVGNGGDVIRCSNSTSFKSLDYVVAKSLFKNTITPVPQTNLIASLQRISDLLKNKIPQLSSSFVKFVQDLENHTDQSKRHIWLNVGDDLPDIADEDLVSIPLSCRYSHGGFGVSSDLRQAVVREFSLEKIIFYYDDRLLANLAPVQLSFLFVHEWLWSISTSVSEIRKINYFLHSNLFTQLSAKEATAQMNMFGIKLVSGSAEEHE